MNCMMKNKKAAFALFVALFFVFWNILDYLYATFITRSGYQFSAIGDMSIPLVAAIMIGYFICLRKSKD